MQTGLQRSVFLSWVRNANCSDVGIVGAATLEFRRLSKKCLGFWTTETGPTPRREAPAKSCRRELHRDA